MIVDKLIAFFCAFLGCVAVQSTASYGYTPAAMPTNTALQGAATITYPGGVTRDTFGNNNGAPPLFFLPSNAACSLNSGNGDGGSQVKSADNKCWLAVFPAQGADARQWGVLFDGGVADNTASLQAAFNWAALGNVLVLPGGTAYHSSGISVIMTSLTARMTVIGAGAEATVLGFTGSSGNGITVTETNNTGARNSFNFDKFTYCTNKAGLAEGIQFLQTANIGTGSIPFSHFGLTLRGCDGAVKTDYWSLGAGFGGIFGVDFTNLDVEGPSVSGVGSGVSIANGSSAIVAQFNFPGAIFNSLLVGITFSANVQGVAVTSGANFTAVGKAVEVTSGTGTDQLMISDSQFNCSNICIHSAGADVFVRGNYFILSANSAIGVYFSGTNGAVVQGNAFRNGGSSTGTTALRFDSTDITKSIAVSGNVGIGLAHSVFIGAPAEISMNVVGNAWGTASPLITAGSTINWDQPLPYADVTPPAASVSAIQQFSDSTTNVWGLAIGGGASFGVMGLNDGSSWTVMGK